MKIDIDEIPRILIGLNLTQDVVAKVSDKVRQVAEQNAPEPAEPGDKKKYKHLVVVMDANGQYAQVDELPMWVVKVTEETPHTDVLNIINKAVYDYNANSRKGRTKPIKTIGEAMEVLKAKQFKPAKHPIVTKEPVVVLVTDGKIPNK